MKLLEYTAGEIFITIMAEGKCLLWFDNIACSSMTCTREEQKGIIIKDSCYLCGEYWAYFPSF